MSILEAIKQGRQNALANEVEYGAPRKVKDHPNINLKLPEMKHWIVTRRVQDTRLGEKGDVKLAIYAVNAPDAAKIADAWCEYWNLKWQGKKPERELPSGVVVRNQKGKK